MKSANEKFFKIVKELPNGDTVIELKARVVRPIMGGKILKTSDEAVTIVASPGSVFRIGAYIYIWRTDLKQLELQC